MHEGVEVQRNRRCGSGQGSRVGRAEGGMGWAGQEVRGWAGQKEAWDGQGSRRRRVGRAGGAEGRRRCGMGRAAEVGGGAEVTAVQV